MGDDCLLTTAFLTHIQGCQDCRNLLGEILQQIMYPVNIPEIDLAELDECPWQTFQKTKAGPGTAAWIKNPAHFEHFDAPKVLWELVKAMEGKKDHKLVLGDMEYVFGGKEGQFINRKPAKMERAR